VGPAGDVVDGAVPAWVLGGGCGSLVQAAASKSIAARRRQAVISSAYPGEVCSAPRQNPTCRVELAMTMLETAEIRWFFKDSASRDELNRLSDLGCRLAPGKPGASATRVSGRLASRT